jgi:TolB-like protein/tetratricopeptide (TPR) repeat protein
MELLIFLVGRRERLVTREDIVAKLWHSDLFIDTERNINNIVRRIRRALGDNAAKPRFLETVVGKGYRFVGPIRVIDAPAPSSDLSAGQQTSLALPDSSGWQTERASLAVLPLSLKGPEQGDDKDDEKDDRGLSLGFAETLISRLGNLQGIDVLPATAVLDVPTGLAASEIAARLGVRFVVHGVLQKADAQCRVWIELYDVHLQSSSFARKFDLDTSSLFDVTREVAGRVAGALRRPFRDAGPQSRARHSRDQLAYAEFMRGFRLSSSGDPKLLEEATQHLMTAVARDPAFALAHATLSYVCAARHYEFDPSRFWLERAEFHCQRALDLDSGLAEGHVAKAFLLWGPSKNFQHLEAIAELKHALAMQKNVSHAYNRLGTILAHIGLLDHARSMYEMGRPFNPHKTVSHSVVQVFLWGGEYSAAREELRAWRAENPASKYAIYFAPQPAMLSGDWKEAESLLDEALHLMPEEPLIISLQGLMRALTGKGAEALECMSRACAIPKSFGHAHHTYYQIACILSLLQRCEAAFEWLERSVDAGFACWPFFLKDPCLRNLRNLPQFELLVSSLQAKYPDHLGVL